MSTGQTPDLNGPLKKSPAKEPEKKGLGGKALSSRSLGGGLGGESAPAAPVAPSAPVAPAAPVAPISYELNSEPEEKKAPAAEAPASTFNPFDDADVATPNTPTAPPSPAPGTGRVAKSGTDRVSKKESRDFGDNFDPPAPGVSKDLWSCPHCGAKNKPQRDTCRECHKSPDDPIEKMWFQKPKIAGPVVGAVVVFIFLIMRITSVDLSLKPAGVMDSSVRYSSASEELIDLGDNRKLFVRKNASVSGRVITASQYPIAPWLIGVALALGDKAKDDEYFGAYEASFTDSGMNVDADNHTILYLWFDGEKPDIKPGDYLSVSGKAGIPEQNALIVRGTDEKNSFAIKVQKFKHK